jgi:hypothetical protein
MGQCCNVRRLAEQGALAMQKDIDLSLFDTRPYPENKPVVDPEMPRDGWERDGVAVFFQGKRNVDLTLKALEAEYRYDCSGFHHHLSDEAFVFFLPGLMRLVLQHHEEDQIGLLGDSLVSTFLRMAKGEMGHRLDPVVTAYSNQQMAVVARFLVAFSQLYPYPIPEKDPALAALRLFWGQFLPGGHAKHHEATT